MTQRLDGQVALITGSTSGIGLGIAQELVANGARVILNGIETADQGAAIAETLGDAAVCQLRVFPDHRSGFCARAFA